MKRALARAQGYTIIETLIFLAITGSLFVTVAILITGQQSKTEFNQGVRDLESSMQDISNDISTGYYANTNNFSCTATNTPNVRPTVQSAASNSQGANNGCTFIGKVVQFAPSDANKSTYKIYTVVGKQKYNNNDASNLSEAMPTAIFPISGNNVPDGSDTKTISGGVTAEWVKYVNNSTSVQVGAFGFFTSFGKLSGSTGVLSGTQDVQLIPVPNTAGTSSDQTASSINGMNSNASLVINPSGGVQVCLQSNGNSSQYAIMTIGGNGRSSSVALTYNSGSCPAP